MSSTKGVLSGTSLALAALIVFWGGLLAANSEAELGAGDGPAGIPGISPTPACMPPSGWRLHSVQPGDNLLVLAARLGTTPEEIQAGNCMEGETKLGETLYLPGEVEVETPPAATCGPPSGWSLYEVADGEDFVDLSRRYSVSEDLLREANCLGPANRLHSGMRIFVPAPPTPTRTEFAVTSFPTSTPTLSTPAPQETETPPNP